MLLEKQRKDIVTYCRRLISDGLTVGTGGNISIYDPESGLFAISPSGIEYSAMTPVDVVVSDLDGRIVEGSRNPSTEFSLHRIFYQKRPDIKAVVHAHSTYCTVLATNRMELPASSYLIAYSGGENVRCGKYACFGTQELAENTLAAMEGRKAALMANHGLLTGGKDIKEAYAIAMQVEFCARVYVKALSVGSPVILSPEEIQDTMRQLGNYGQKQ